MDIDDMKKVMAALEGQPLQHAGYFNMEHDILYIPWFEEKGPVAEALEAAGCHWDTSAESWASF